MSPMETLKANSGGWVSAGRSGGGRRGSLLTDRVSPELDDEVGYDVAETGKESYLCKNGEKDEARE